MGRDEESVREALDIESGLSRWEAEFVESLRRQVLDQRRPLNDQQRSKLDDILTKVPRGSSKRSRGLAVLALATLFSSCVWTGVTYGVGFDDHPFWTRGSTGERLRGTVELHFSFKEDHRGEDR